MIAPPAWYSIGMITSRAASIALAATLLACDDHRRADVEGEQGEDVEEEHDAGVEAGGDLAVACVTPDEPTYQPWSNDVPQEPLCEEPDRVALPSGGVIRDVSAMAAGQPGTCGDHEEGGDGIVEIDTAVGFPQWIRLPAAPGRDPACTALCNAGPPDTAFGITFRMSSTPPGDMMITVRAEAPWYWVMGDELSPVPCLDGKPTVLEYGMPLSCGTFVAGSFGFATDDPDAPAAWAVIDLIPRTSTPLCCPYTCAAAP